MKRYFIRKDWDECIAWVDQYRADRKVKTLTQMIQELRDELVYGKHPIVDERDRIEVVFQEESPLEPEKRKTVLHTDKCE